MSSLPVPKKAHKQAGEELLTMAYSDRIVGNGFKVKESRLR